MRKSYQTSGSGSCQRFKWAVRHGGVLSGGTPPPTKRKEFMETKERPIIFGTWAIPKLQDGSKTQTRRTKGLKKINESPNDWVYQGNNLVDNHYYFYHRDYVEHKSGDTQMKTIKCPYGQVGDRLWVKETFCKLNNGELIYKASEVPSHYANNGTPTYAYRKWTPSIHMPRWASRIDLEITDIRAERLQSITEGDAIAEGTDPNEPWGFFDGYLNSFGWLWDSINGKKYPWDSNPWVWVISFKKEVG